MIRLEKANGLLIGMIDSACVGPKPDHLLREGNDLRYSIFCTNHAGGDKLRWHSLIPAPRLPSCSH